MVQLALWSLWRLGAMDSLHVSSQQTGSKTSSRSASPCRPREQQQQQQQLQQQHQPYHPHHTKTLSHGSVDSSKVSHSKIHLLGISFYGYYLNIHTQWTKNLETPNCLLNGWSELYKNNVVRFTIFLIFIISHFGFFLYIVPLKFPLQHQFNRIQYL
uniref:Protein kibra-like n=1 Tax=Diabrotica virgifera virgifera TaxID=50390 RepID=A0A6P7GSE4_DIAVI